jgi:hypothetical protein
MSLNYCVGIGEWIVGLAWRDGRRVADDGVGVDASAALIKLSLGSDVCSS